MLVFKIESFNLKHSDLISWTICFMLTLCVGVLCCRLSHDLILYDRTRGIVFAWFKTETKVGLADHKYLLF